MYHVEVKKVRTKVISSIFPDNSNFSGADLQKNSLSNQHFRGCYVQHSLNSEKQIINDVFNNVFWEHPERHGDLFG
jgi:uncharacterized protein YjbI with pentapeptide repeats